MTWGSLVVQYVIILYFRNAQNNPDLARNIFTQGLDRFLEEPPMKDLRLTLTRVLRDRTPRDGRVEPGRGILTVEDV